MSQAEERVEWHWLWNVYIVGICVAAIAAVVTLKDKYPGNIPVATSALAAVVLCVFVLIRQTRPTPVLLSVVVGLWVIAVWASPIAVAAVPALYPLAFAALPLRVALVATSVITAIPLALMLLQQGIHTPDLAVAVALTVVGLVTAPIIGIEIVTGMKQRKRLAAVVEELAASRAESARLSREAGTAAERERLAREIHDTLAQGFTSIVALAQAVEPELDTDAAAAKRHLELIRTTARENLAEARAMVAELSPTALDDGTLTAAIQRQCDRLATELSIPVSVRTDDDLPALGMAADVVFLRAAQEALANIRKHARASAVSVALSSSHGSVRLSVTDNGIGVDGGRSEGFGLRGMRARVKQVGGTMTVASTPGGGTTVTVEVPA